MPGFLSPWFLLGLGALAVPILVHLIHRERKEVQAFPSLMFLQRIPYQAVRRQKIRNWLLFLMRCLAVILLVAAFARPFLDSRAAVAGGVAGARDVVILLDRSYSMGYGDRWNRAVAAARETIGKLGGEDRAAIVTFAGTAEAAGDLTRDKVLLTALLDSIRPGSGITRFDAAFKLAQRILGDSSRARREVVLITDFQRTGWDGREVPQLPRGATLTRVDLSDSVTRNVAVTSVEVRRETGADRERVVVSARLANRGPDAIAGHAVALDINGREMERRTVDLPANGATSVEFAAQPVPQGAARGTVRSADDALAADNAFHVVLSRGQSLSVLVVDPPDARAGSSLFLVRALGIGNRPSFAVETRTAGRFTAGDLAGRSLVVLNDAAVPGGELGRRLTEWVRAGGGLLVVVGDRSAPRDWPAEADLLVSRPSAAPVDRLADRGATLGFLDRSHPVFEPFNAPRSGDFSAARFFRYRAIATGPDDRQLARFDDGNPALQERRVGSGRVLVWSSSLDGIWNDLPLQPVFLPFVQQAAKYAAGYREERPWTTVGQVASPGALFGDGRTTGGDSASLAAAAAADAGAEYEATTPAGARVRFGVTGAPASLELAEPGFYEARRTGGRGGAGRIVAVNVDLAESDLTPLDPELLATAVQPRVTAEDTAPGEEPTPQEMERRQGIWWFLLAGALLLLGTETVLANRMSRAAR